MSNLIKYPCTPHLPFSPGATSDDKFMSKKGLDFLKSGIDLVVTEKMDGGNLTFYRDAFHGRSLDSGTHHWDTLARQLWSQVRFDIPEGWRISGESLYARRSVAYDNLPGPYMVFGIWDENNDQLAWDDVVMWCELLCLPHVPVLYRGSSFDTAVNVWSSLLDTKTSEGFVVRNAESFNYEVFHQNVVKWVRANHVQTAADWRHRDDYDVNTFSKGR